MSATTGVELGPELIRAVRLDRWGRSGPRTFEQHWDPANPAEAFHSLHESMGKIGRLAVTVDLSFLFAKQVRLPSLSAAEKRRILTLEPERFFPVRAEDLVLAVRGEDNLVFAARAAELTGWLEILETIAPIVLVEAGPVSLARALRQADPGAATIMLEEKLEGIGIASVEDGRVRRLRRVRGEPSDLSASVAASDEGSGRLYFRPLNGNHGWRPPGAPNASELPSVAGIAPPYLVAYGAALGLGADVGEAMLPAELSRRILGRRRRSLVRGGVGFTLALALAWLSIDGYRARTLHKLDVEISRVKDRAEAVLALQQQADSFSRKAGLVSAMEAQRLDLVGGLAALTRRLPAGAYLAALRSTGPEWQIDGYARESARLVAGLEADPLFDDVHFLSATSRTQVNGKAYESFSIAFRLVPAP